MNVNVAEINPHPLPWVFTEAAELLVRNIRLAGYQSRHLENEIVPGEWNIIIGASLNSNIQQCDPRKTIVFNFEQLGSDSHIVTDAYRQMLLDYPVFDYHSDNIRHLLAMGANPLRCHEIPIRPLSGATSKLNTRVAPSVDVCFYGSKVARRANVLNQLRERGLVVEEVSGAYGRYLHPALLRSRLVLHVHYYDTALFPVLRAATPAMLGIPIVSETSRQSEQCSWGDSGVKFVDYNSLVDACVELLQDQQQRTERIAQMTRWIQTIPFAPSFHSAMETLLRLSDK